MKQKYSFSDNVNNAISVVNGVPYFTYLISENINIQVWENNNALIGAPNSSDVIGLLYHGDKSINGCNIYISPQNKMSVPEIVFLIMYGCLYSSFGLYKNYEKQTIKEKKANFLYVFAYIYNVMGYKNVPSCWNNVLQNINILNTKNKESVLANLEKAEIYNHFVNYGLSNTASGIEKVFIKNKDELGNFKYLANRHNTSFEDSFSKGIVTNAAKVLKQTNKSVVQVSHPIQEWFFRNYPFFSSLSSLFKVVTDRDTCRTLNIHYGAVDFYQKIIYLNEFNLPKGDNDVNQYQVFVMAHEMLHVALNHAGRRKDREHLMWNLACDFVINNWLVDMCVGIPPEGVFIDKELARLSAEEIYELLKEDREILRQMMTMASPGAGHKYNKHKNKNSHVDMFGTGDKENPYGDLHDAAAQALLQGYNVHCNLERGLLPAGLEEEIKLLQQPVIPWRVELASWFARHFPEEEKKRTYAKASRRQSVTPDIPHATYYRPTKETKTKTFGVILDTSGSMDHVLLGKSLGIIAAYAKQYDVFEVKLIYCDANPYDAGYVKVDSLKDRVKVTGRGGTVLQQAVNYLENNKDFPSKAPVLVLTDGYFEPTLAIRNPHAFVVPDKRLLRGRTNVFEFD